MRLINLHDDGSISFTKDLSDHEIPAHRYAILSHTWGPDEEEATFEDVASGRWQSKPGIGSEKIRFCMQQARLDKLHYFWLDTCCIDKRNLVELDRSLRSMFRWYARAERCYVFLSDVMQSEQSDGLAEEWTQAFRASRWFQRGWTLQELISPRTIAFFSRYGISLGTKVSLEQQINHITRIPIPALRGKALSDFTIQERRQWQEGRETREPEDLVYSLLGLLDISMPVLYGEGRDHAWERLESAIEVSQKGRRHMQFSLAFSLADAAVETQHFIARGLELQKMHQQLHSDGSRRLLVLHGLGGIGKTQLAMAYAKQHRDDYSALLWMNAKDEISIRSSFARIAKQILRAHPRVQGLAGLDLSRDLDDVIDAVKSWLSLPSNSRWLLICDNYDNPKVPGNTDAMAVDIRHHLPEAHQGSVIITTRSSEVKLGYNMLVSKLRDLNDSIQILEHSSGRESLHKDPDAVRLAKSLDGLPLALATAGAYLSQSTVTFEEYLQYFEGSWAQLQKKSPALLTYEDRTLYSTWQVSYEQIKKRNAQAADLLRLWAYFDNQDLWYELVRHISAQKQQWDDKLDFDDCMRVLCDHGLAEINTMNTYEVESTGYSVHACVHAWMLAVINAGCNHDLLKVAVRCVASHVPRRAERNWSLLQRRILDHASRCMNLASQEALDDPSLSWAFATFGGLYKTQGKLVEAEKLYKTALHGHERALGANHKKTLDTTADLGSLYKTQGRLAEAEIELMRALQGYERSLGSDHIATLDTVHNIGSLLKNQGKFVEAERMYLKSLVGTEKALGPDHKSTLDTVNNLGSLYKNLDRLDEAEMMLLRALRGSEKSLGVNHKSTLDTMNNLGSLYKNQGRLEEAEDMYMRALAGTEKVLGADHKSTLDTVHNLGSLYEKQDKLDAAEQMYLRALEGTERAMGLEHKSTLSTVNNLGTLYQTQGRMVEAEAMLLRALNGSEMTLGPLHKSTLDSANNLGSLYRAQGRLDEADELLMRALEGSQQMLGERHKSTIKTIINLAHLRNDQGRVEEANAFYAML